MRRRRKKEIISRNGIVKSPPFVTIKDIKLLLDVDSIEGNEARWPNSIEDSFPREIDLSISSNQESGNNNQAGENCTGGSGFSKDGVSEKNVEDNAQGTGDLEGESWVWFLMFFFFSFIKEEKKSNLIESDFNILKAKIIENQHSDVDEGEGKDLTADMEIELKGRDQRKQRDPKDNRLD